ELHVNGRRVGNDLFTPGWTDYRQRVYYNTYDITDFIQGGVNCAGAIVGEGWYCGYLAMVLGRMRGMNTQKKREHYGDRPYLRVQLRIEFSDGSVHTLGTNESWRGSTAGPLLASDLLMGETFDARKE